MPDIACCQETFKGFSLSFLIDRKVEYSPFSVFLFSLIYSVDNHVKKKVYTGQLCSPMKK